MKIVYIVGSLSAESLNRRLAQVLVENAPENVEMVEAKIADLPLFNRDLEQNFPPAAREFKELVASADGVLFITPEHNRSYSAALHNAIEWTSRPYGEWALADKPVATIGTSTGGIGTAVGQQSLRSSLMFFGCKVMGQPEGYINAEASGIAKGEIAPDSEEFLRSWIHTFADFVAAQK